MSAASPPLSPPLPGASFGQAISRFFRKYATFRGRASKSEFWWVALFLFLVALVPNTLLAIGLTSGLVHSFGERVPVSAGTDPDTAALVGYAHPPLLDDPTAMALIPLGALLGGILFAALAVPTLALVWRRLHDAGLAGPWFLVTLLPVVGVLFFLVLMLQPTARGARRFDAPA